MPVTTVYLVRHGRTVLNAAGRFRGLQDPPLDEVGLADARAAASWLAVVPLAAVYTSTLARARETARAIADGRAIAPDVLAELLDLDHGRWTALTAAEAEASDPQGFARFRSDPLTCTPPGGEPLRSVAERMSSAMLRLAERHPGANVVAVSHEIPLRLLIGSLLGTEGSGLWDLPLPTGSITEIHATPSGATVATMPFAPARAD